MTTPLEKLIVTQPFGARPEYYRQFGLSGHEGVDFQTRNLGTSQGWFSNLMGWQKAIAVTDGTCVAHYGHPQYGTYIDLTDAQGNLYMYCHLKNASPPSPASVLVNGRPFLTYTVKEGDTIGITDTSGNATGPHLHFMYRPAQYDVHNGYFGFVDPMQLFNAYVFPRVPLKIARIGTNLPSGDDFKASVAQYSSGKITIEFVDYPGINLAGHINQDDAYALVSKLNIVEKFVMLFFIPLVPNEYYTSYQYPAGDKVITTAPGFDPKNLAFEFAHQLQLFYMLHRTKPITITDVPSNNSFTILDDLIKEKYDSVAGVYS